jgi:multidrug efflux pump subunit AcrB
VAGLCPGYQPENQSQDENSPQIKQREAVIRSGAVRFRLILLTAGAAMFGSWIITLDPIFSGLAWSFIFGLFASSAFSLVVVPLIYYLLASRKGVGAGNQD